jgi:hypothetical protein
MQKFKLKNSKVLYLVLVLVLFAAGMAIRLFDLQDAPLDFHSTRQLHSALMVRGMYYSIASEANFPEAQRQLAIRQWQLEGLVEPPLLEWLVALTYRFAGGVYLWIARLYAILFWMLAGIGILLIAREVVGDEGSLVALALFLFIPYSVYASRSFQPETLLVACLVFVFWAAMKWNQHQTWKWAIMAGLLGGLAILVKAVAVFFVAGIWLGLLFSQWKLTQIIKKQQLWLVGILSLIPYLLFMLYVRLNVAGYVGQFSLRFFPQLWSQVGFYLRWVGTLRKAIGLEWLVLGLLGTLLVTEKTWRWMLIGAWLGYLSLGFTLPYHISTHDYYNLPVYLMATIGAGVLIQKAIHFQSAQLIQKIAILAVLAFALAIYGYESYSTLKKTDYSREVSFWQMMGTRLGPDVKVVALSEDYGYRLAYWGWVSPVNWMTTDDIRLRTESGQRYDFQQYFDSTIQDKDFFLITLLDEFNQQPDLKNALEGKYTVVLQTDRLLLFDLKHPIQ